MKILRRFIWATHEDSGDEGWIAAWIPRSASFTPCGGAGFMHDMLEHQLCDRGTFRDEALAFGRTIALRLESGVLSSYSSTSRAERFGEDLYYAWAHDSEEHCPHFDAPRLGRTTDARWHISESIQAACSGFAKAFIRDERGEHREVDKAWLAGRCTALANLLQLGYCDALRRYGGANACCSLGWAMQSFTEGQAKQMPKGEDGDVLTVVFDTQDGEAKLRVTERRFRREDDFEALHPQWARDLYRAWRRS